MENATEALKMAAAVLIFVLALSISIGAYGQARQTAQVILDYKDREYDYTYVPDSGQKERIVGIETIIPSIYKAYKENYKIVFVTRKINDDEGIYKKKKKNGTEYEPIFSIDLEKEVLGSDTQKETFILAILYGNKIENFQKIKDEFRTNLGIELHDRGIYDIIKTTTFREKLGVYYQEDVEGQSDSPDANKNKKRVITYEEE